MNLHVANQIPIVDDRPAFFMQRQLHGASEQTERTVVIWNMGLGVVAAYLARCENLT
jgi:hypothetical protein